MRFAFYIVLALCLTISQSKQIAGGWSQVKVNLSQDMLDVLTHVSQQALPQCNKVFFNFPEKSYFNSLVSFQYAPQSYGTAYIFTLRGSNDYKYEVTAIEKTRSRGGTLQLQDFSCNTARSF